MHSKVIAAVTVAMTLLAGVAAAQGGRVQPSGFILSPGQAKLIRAGDKAALTALPVDLLYPGDRLQAGTQPVTFVSCQKKMTHQLEPGGEVVFSNDGLRAKGRLVDVKPVTTCQMPSVARLGAASEQHYGVSMTRGIPTLGDLKPREQLSEPLRRELAPLDAALNADPQDVTSLITRAALFEQEKVLPNAVADYRTIARLWPDALWVKGKIFRLEETLALEAAAAMASDLGGQTYAVVVGISKYQRLPSDLQLHFADADARMFSEHLRTERGGAVPAANIKTLLNEDANLAGVRNALNRVVRERLAAGAKKDTLVLFIATHGLVENPGSKSAYILTSDSDIQDLASTALPMSELREIMDQALSTAGRVVVYLDVCRAGTLGSIRGNSVNTTVERMSDLEGELITFLAGGPKEVSNEGTEYGNGHGAFTYFVVKGLGGEADSDKSGSVTVGELGLYVPSRVAEATRRKPQRQLPRFFGNMSSDVPLSWPAKPGIEISGASDIPGNLLAANTPTTAAAATALDTFDRALRERRLLPGTSGNAFELLDHLRTAANPAQVNERTNALRVALENEANQVLLRYLQGDENPQSEADFEMGLRLTEAAQKLTPESVLLEARKNFFEGRVLLFQKKYAEATLLLEKATRLDPTGAYALNALGIACLQQGRFVEASAALQDASRRAVYWAYPMHNLALASAEIGDYRNAIKLYQEAIRKNPGLGYLSYNLGVLYMKLNRKKEAEQQLARSITLLKDSPEPYNALGTLRAEQNRLDEAEDLYKKAMARGPRLPTARHNLALLYASTKQDQTSAIELWESVLDRDPDYIPARLSLAELREKRGDLQGAAAEYRKLLELRTNYVAARIALSKVLIKQNQRAEAVEQLRHAAAATEINAELLVSAAEAAESLDSTEEAVRFYQRALDLVPDPATSKRIRRKLAVMSAQQPRA